MQERDDTVTIGLDEFIERVQDNYLMMMVRRAASLGNDTFFSRAELLEWLINGDAE